MELDVGDVSLPTLVRQVGDEAHDAGNAELRRDLLAANPQFSPDGRHLTWLDSADDSLSKELFALELAAAEETPLIISDMKMPGHDKAMDPAQNAARAASSAARVARSSVAMCRE